MPIEVAKGWNLITRPIIPVIRQPDLIDGGETWGLADIQLQTYLSPAGADKVIWGVGPVFQFPSATNGKKLGTEKWSAGPAAVALTMPGKWVIGGLINNLWSFAGDSDREDVNLMTIQPFVNYNLPEGRYVYAYTLDSPGMIMRIPHVGSQYLMGFLDADGNPFDGAKAYKVTLPKDIPARAFWSFTLYDNQTRSMLQTPQQYPRAGSQSYPSPAAASAADGSTSVWFSPEQPDGVARGNWIQTDPEKGWFTILRLYSPLPPFFDKSWRPGEIELVG